MLKKAKTEFPYKSTNHCVSTSVMVETLFSRCGIIMRPHRRCMDPSTLERLVFLRSNKDLWGEEQVDQVMKSSPDADVAPPSTPLSQSLSGSTGVLLDLDLDQGWGTVYAIYNILTIYCNICNIPIYCSLKQTLQYIWCVRGEYCNIYGALRSEATIYCNIAQYGYNSSFW